MWWRAIVSQGAMRWSRCLFSAGKPGLQFSKALVRDVASTFAEAAIRSNAAHTISQELVVAQHAAYTKALSELLGSVHAVRRLDADNAQPDCVFIEDTAVVVGNTALICNPGARSRQGEPRPVATALEDMGKHIVRLSARATIDGGDVLWTGSELLVGLSSRTNAEGAMALARAFPGVRTSAIPLGRLSKAARRTAQRAGAPHQDTLHLKSILSIVGPGTLAVADTALGREVAYAIQDAVAVPRAARRAGGELAFLLLPDAQAANVVYANGRFVMQASHLYPQSAEVLHRYAQESGLAPPLEVDCSELAKADGALTCCSILLL